MGSSQGAEASAAATTQTTQASNLEKEHGSASVPETATSDEEVACVKFDCLMNARYHATREAFLDNVHRWFMFGVIAFGASAVIDAFGGVWWLKGIFGLGATILGALDLTFDLSNRARAHSLMKRRYFELLADIEEERKTPEEARACLHRYSADEEPAYHAVIASSFNSAQEMVYGDHAMEYAIPERDLFFQNFWRFDGKRYPLRQRD
jgi:hypothetical protein